MAQITIRRIPDEVHRALKAKAQLEGQSAEALVRKILAETLFPDDRLRPGDLLRSVWQGADLKYVEFERDHSPLQGASFE